MREVVRIHIHNTPPITCLITMGYAGEPTRLHFEGTNENSGWTDCSSLSRAQG